MGAGHQHQCDEHDHGPHGHDHAHESHGHGHAAHGHGHHHHVVGSFGVAFAIAVGLNLAFVIIEVVAGFASSSMALLADAGHNFSDVLALLLSWGASVLATRPPSARFTWGLKGSSILAAMTNAALLWVALGAILIETIRRFANPAPVHGGMVMAVAGAGILVNGICALLFVGGRKHDLNLRAAFQHLAADAAVSVGVVGAGALVVLTGRAWIDPVTSLVITAIIGLGSWGLLRDSVRLGLAAVPESINEGDVRDFLQHLPGVEAVHDLHIWPMSTTETAFTAHLVMPGGYPGDAFLHTVASEMERHFAIGHTTIQVETSDGHPCVLAPEEVV
jgi:cobalt-zinc-cadmium efflux system protein